MCTQIIVLYAILTTHTGKITATKIASDLLTLNHTSGLLTLSYRYIEVSLRFVIEKDLIYLTYSPWLSYGSVPSNRDSYNYCNDKAACLIPSRVIELRKSVFSFTYNFNNILMQ